MRKLVFCLLVFLRTLLICSTCQWTGNAAGNYKDGELLFFKCTYTCLSKVWNVLPCVDSMEEMYEEYMCGCPTNTPRLGNVRKIIRGSEAVKNSWPWQVNNLNLLVKILAKT